MKLKKTLSVLIGGICLVAATTVALAGPWAKCVRCDGDMPGILQSSYSVNGSHVVHPDPKRPNYQFVCQYTNQYKKYKFTCSRCGSYFYADRNNVHNLNHR